MSTLVFEVSEAQQKEAAEWCAAQPPDPLEGRRIKLGDRYSWVFTPSSIGTMVSIHDQVHDHWLDLTGDI